MWLCMNFRQNTLTSFYHRLFYCLILKDALGVFSHKGSFTHDEMSTKKIVEVEIFLVDLSFSGLDKLFVCMLSRPIWDEFPQSPGRYYFELNRKLIFAQAFVRLSYSTVLYHKVDRLFSRSRYDHP